SSWSAISGYCAVTGQQVLLLGYSDSTFTNHVRASPAQQYSPAVTSGTPFMLNGATEIASGGDILDVGVVGNDAVIVHGGFESSPPYASFTESVERITLGGSGSTVTVGAHIAMLTSSDQCTSVLFTARTGSNLLLGISDKNGARLVTVSP